LYVNTYVTDCQLYISAENKIKYVLNQSINKNFSLFLTQFMSSVCIVNKCPFGGKAGAGVRGGKGAFRQWLLARDQGG
jgi:hypothetical protein